MKPLLRRYFSNEILISCLVVGLVTVLAYGPFLPKLGFYQEDLNNIWAGTTRGAQGLLASFAGERPVIGYQFVVLYPVLGNSPLNWQIYGLLVRLLTIFAFFWLVRLIWRDKPLQAFSATLLFAVYPGFLQQPQAHTFQIAFEAFAIAILSIGLTVQSVREKSLGKIIALNLAALVLMVFYLGLMEYAIGLEPVRWILVWYLLRREHALPQREAFARIARQIARQIAPYLLTLAVFLYWRLFIFQSTRSASNTQHLLGIYGQNPLSRLPRIALEAGRDFLETVFMAWSVPLYRYLYYAPARTILASLAIALVGCLLVWGAYRWLQARKPVVGLPSDYENRNSDNHDWVWIGALAILFALLAPIAANRSVRFIDRFDRYTLTATVGVAIFITGLIFSFLQARAQVWAVIFLTGIALVTHFYNGLFMSDLWTVQKQVWWQLSWRAPQLEEGTLLFAVLPSGFSLAEGYEVWGPANLIYYPDSPTPVVAGEVLDRETMQAITRGRLIHSGDWWIPMDLDYQKPLIVSLADRQSCLNVIDGRKYELAGSEDFQVQQVAAYSRIDLIQTGGIAKSPPATIFGPEPEHGWCYYYQKAMLARQMGDWQEIIRLGDEVRQNKIGPVYKVEWMPFLEGYASTGRDKEAKNLAAIIKTESGARNLVCDQLQTRPDYPETYAYEKIVQYLCTYKD